MATLLAFGMTLALGSGPASAHAEYDRSIPAADSTVDTSPAQVGVWFTEEVTSATTLEVTGPEGTRVDAGDSALDLYDPNRQHVTVSLKPNLPPGEYTVKWTSVSAEDGDTATGEFAFGVARMATPVASPIASPVAVGVTGSTVTSAPVDDSEFDSRAFFLSVGAGILVAIGIFLFWRLVRPKNPLFG